MIPAPRLAQTARLLVFAEQAAALLDRTRPVEATALTEELVGCFMRGEAVLPEFRYHAPPDLSSLRDTLERETERLATSDPWDVLYLGRAEELLSELSLVEALGTKEFRGLAAVRFPAEPGAAGLAADAVAEEWVRVAPDESGERVPSDDMNDPRSLVRVTGALVGELRLPVRVVTSRNQASAAATGAGLVVVRAGVLHTVNAARRIALHEIHAHALPRATAAHEVNPLYRVGTVGGSQDEEGRALLIEARHALLGPARQHELGARHVAARLVRSGADFVETVRGLESRGVELAFAVRTAARAHRGGGLAREIVYLPALARVKEAFARDPRLEDWLCRGRVSVSAARVLRELEGRDPGAIRQVNVATTGA